MYGWQRVSDAVITSSETIWKTQNMKGKLISVFLLIHQANAGAFSGLISNLVTL